MGIGALLEGLERSGAHGFSRRLRFYLSVISWQIRAPRSASWTERRTLWRGFKPSSYVLYSLDRNDPADYLPDTAFYHLKRLNGAFATQVLTDKLLFSSLLGAYLPVPEVLAVVEQGRLFAARPDAAVRDVPSLLARSECPGGVILKPNTGRQGNGVRQLVVDKRGILLDGQALRELELRSQLAELDAYLVVASVVQADYAARIYSGAVNSLRVLTLQDPAADDQPFVIAAGHRFGALGTGATDNIARGGLHARVDLDTGTLGPASKAPERAGGKLIWHASHPNTGARIEGVRVPGFDLVQERLLSAAQQFPYLRYVGWDVVVTPRGFWVLEGNAVPALTGQVFGPFLRDPRVRDVYKRYGVL